MKQEEGFDLKRMEDQRQRLLECNGTYRSPAIAPYCFYESITGYGEGRRTMEWVEGVKEVSAILSFYTSPSDLP